MSVRGQKRPWQLLQVDWGGHSYPHPPRSERGGSESGGEGGKREGDREREDNGFKNISFPGVVIINYRHYNYTDISTPCTHKHAHMRTYVFIHTHTHSHTHPHTHTHTPHTHTHTPTPHTHTHPHPHTPHTPTPTPTPTTHTHTHTHTHHTHHTPTHTPTHTRTPTHTPTPTTHTHTPHTQSKKSKKQSVSLPLSGHAIWHSQNARALSGPLSQCNATSWSRARNSQVDWQNLLSMWCGYPKSHLDHSWYEGTVSYFAPKQ